RAAPAGEAWVAAIRMARIREWPTSEVLQALFQRSQAVGGGAAVMGAAYGSDRADTSHCRIASGEQRHGGAQRQSRIGAFHMSWLKFLRRKEVQEREFDRELRFHIEELTRDNIAAGMTPEEAWRQAMLEFGGKEQMTEELREIHRLPVIETLATN